MPGPPPRATGIGYVVMAEVAYQWGELAQRLYGSGPPHRLAAHNIGALDYGRQQARGTDSAIGRLMLSTERRARTTSCPRGRGTPIGTSGA